MVSKAVFSSKDRIVNALNAIEKQFDRGPINFKKPPLEQLIATILSQSTNWRNVELALNNLKEEKMLSLDGILNLGPEKLAETIKPAGLHKIKSKKIYQIALILEKEYDGSLEPLLNLPYKEARAKLMALPGIGPKTADVLLAFSRKRPILPVDRHIFRISKRLNIIGEKSEYEETRSTLEAYVPPEKRVKIHITLIEFGRNICKANNPKCLECPIGDLCPSKPFFIRDQKNPSQ